MRGRRRNSVTKVDAAERGSNKSADIRIFIGRPPVYFQCTCTRSGVYRHHTAPGSAPRARAGRGFHDSQIASDPASSPPALFHLPADRLGLACGYRTVLGCACLDTSYLCLFRLISSCLLGPVNQARPHPGHTETRWTRARDMNTRRKGVHGFTPTPLSRCGSSAASPTPLHA